MSTTLPPAAKDAAAPRATVDTTAAVRQRMIANCQTAAVNLIDLFASWNAIRGERVELGLDPLYTQADFYGSFLQFGPGDVVDQTTGAGTGLMTLLDALVAAAGGMPTLQPVLAKWAQTKL